MRASTNPVLSSIKPADKTTTDSPEQPAEEAKVSSVAETVPATESKLTDYQSILKQIKQRKKSEFRVRNPEIELTGKLTPEELFQLNQKIISVSENWQEKFTFEEFKADKDKLQNHPQHRPLTADEMIENFKAYQDKWQNPQRRHYPPTVHELTDTFNKLKLAGLQWNFIINLVLKIQKLSTLSLSN